MLSICETCEYQGLSFLEFLRSGEQNIEAFAASQPKRRLTARAIGKSSRLTKRPLRRVTATESVGPPRGQQVVD